MAIAAIWEVDCASMSLFSGIMVKISVQALNPDPVPFPLLKVKRGLLLSKVYHYN